MEQAQSSNRFFKSCQALGILGLLSLAVAACGGAGGGGSSTMPAASVNTAGATSAAQDAAGTQASFKNDPTCALQYSANVKAEQVGPDPLLNDQWHLKNTGQKRGQVGEDINVEQAWKMSQGDGVRIALVDDSLEVVHGDLKANIVPDASFNYRPSVRGSSFPLPCNSSEYHGTAVAGIIASRASNGIGTVGIAPKAQLVGYNALSLDLSDDIADALTRDLALNAIYNNSWGSPDNGQINEAEPEFHAAISKGLREGRQGRGAIYIFPAGNGGCYLRSATGTCFQDNANFDGYINHFGVIAVGAVDQNGRLPWYGESGANVLVSAPGGSSGAGITTTAIGNDYNGDFIGSSASAPMASGVIALMLDVNPLLSARDVPIVLARSARKNHVEDSGWVRGFNHKYGFGVIDALAAVNLSKVWKSVGSLDSIKTCTRSIAVGTPISDMGASLQSSVALHDCDIKAIEYVQINVQIDHEYSGDLNIDLISPAGTISALAHQRQCEVTVNRDQNRCGSLSNWQFGSVRHLDEAASGQWRLSVRDGVAGKSGVLRSWSLSVYGR